MSDVSLAGVDYSALIEKAKKISARKSYLEAQISSLEKQAADVEGSLVRDFGENYMAAFSAAVDRVTAWDMEHAEGVGPAAVA